VLSKRDYQTITEVNTAEVLFKKAGQLSFSYRLSKVESEFGLVGIGAFLSADHDINLGISVTQDGNSKSETGINIGKEWTRFGKYLSVGQDASEVRVTMSVLQERRERGDGARQNHVELLPHVGIPP
jgi:hypothetical protein